MKAGIVGASGYLGAELMRLLTAHPDLEVVAAQAEHSTGAISDVYPGLRGTLSDLALTPIDPLALAPCDVVFVAVPSGASQEIIASLYGTVSCVVDLGADFRLKSADLYDTWYGFHHSHPELLDAAVYGMPELFRNELPGAPLIAAPGCYVTASSIALAPFVKAGLIEKTGIIIDAASGSSGAGRAPTDFSHHGAVNENFSAYGLLTHRHTPEIEQTIGAQVLFTPHLAPMTRGILATCYGRATSSTSTKEVIATLQDAYADEPFVVVSDTAPATRSTYGSNAIHLSARYDERTNWIVVLSAIDNLTKGGAGQAIQAANIALGFTETAGLSKVGVTP